MEAEAQAIQHDAVSRPPPTEGLDSRIPARLADPTLIFAAAAETHGIGATRVTNK